MWVIQKYEISYILEMCTGWRVTLFKIGRTWCPQAMGLKCRASATCTKINDCVCALHPLPLDIRCTSGLVLIQLLSSVPGS